MSFHSKLHFQLQQLVHPHSPIPALTAFVLLASLPLVSSGPQTLLTALSRSWLERFTKSATTTNHLGALFRQLMYALTTTCLRIRITVRFPFLWRTGDLKCRGYATYPTPHSEARYWRDATRYRRRLYSGGAQMQEMRGGTCPRASVQLVEYYTPRLLPLYREQKTDESRQIVDDNFTISPKTYCKWHRMVIPYRPHLTLAQSSKQIKRHSPQDLREILRISRLLSNEQVVRLAKRGKYSTKYREIWESYLNRKGMDLVIVFE